jgi:hypothetical protein
VRPGSGLGVLAVAGLLLLVATIPATSAGAVPPTNPENQSFRQYAAGSNGANGYSAATIAVTTVPAGTTTCTTGTKSIPLSGGSATLVFSSTTGGTTCAAGDFSEEFTIAFSATIGSQTNTFTVTTSGAGGIPGVNQEVVALGVGSPSLPFVATVQIYVDYGSVAAPAGGVEVLDLLIT